MGRKPKEQTENAVKMNERSMDVNEVMKSSRTSAIADAIRSGVKVDDDGYGSNPKYIRDMRLTSEQKRRLIVEEIERIIKSKKSEELQGGMIPCFIDYPVDIEGFTVLYSFIKADTRLVRMAWEYYKDNAEKPTVKDFVNVVESIVGRGEQHKRVDHLHLN